MTDSRGGRAPATRVAIAFAAVYLVWGSTYLGIRFAIETLPPFLMAGVRFVTAGAILFGWARLRGAAPPGRREWLACAIIGLFLLLGGNGGVVWAEQRVASGAAALLVATVPLWMVLFDWLRPGGARPTAQVFVGLLVGFGGLALLVGPSRLGAGRIDPVGAGALVLASILWAAGSTYARGAAQPRSKLLATGMQMLAGGAGLLLVGLVAGETGGIDPASFSRRSVLALLYLIFVGSLVGYTAYVYLLGATTAARVSTYAYVNPVVAVLLGWALADEPLTPRMLVAAAIIVGAVAVITTARASGAPARRVPRGGPRVRDRTAA